MQYRWMNQRNHSASRQGAFITQRHNLARKTIENFEKKFIAEEKRIKSVKNFNRDVVEDRKQKFAKVHENHAKVSEKQQIRSEG
jgi:membrane protein involved in colicin uptake